jgi:hypothetical protein
LSYDQITGNGTHKILLTETQKKNTDKSKRLKKGLVLKLSHEQMRINHSGGFLGILAGLATAVGAIASTVINAKHKAAEQAEIKRYN